MKKRIRMFLPVLVTLAMVLSLFGMAIPVVADYDPADSNANSINLDLILPAGEYHIGDTIYFSVVVSTPLAIPAINFYPGKNTEIVTTFTRPDGAVINFAVIPVLNRGEYVVFDYTTYPGLAYVVDAADVDPMQAGVLRAEADVLAISHCSVTGPAPGGNEYASNFREISTEITVEPCIEILKTVDCNDDGIYESEDTGSYGDTPSWKIEVHNCGDSPLHDVYVSDDYGPGWGPFNLDIDETWTVTYDHPEPIYEDTTNEAMAEGLDVFDGAVGPVYSSATNVVEIEPLICIEKLVDCNDDQEYLHEDTGSYGDTPSWYIRVWNCGDSPLLDVMVSDTNGMIWGPFGLDIGEEWEVTYDGDPIFATTTNEATASATDVFGGAVGPVYDSATNVVEIFPDICIEKLVDCNDDQEYLHEDTGSYGDTPSWYIRVWNCGDSPLLNVMVSDTNGMMWGPFDLVNPGDDWEVYYDGDPIYETTTNEAEAYGTDVFGGAVGPVYDSATNVVTGNEGCTPGFWKNNAKNWDHSAWVGYLPGDSFETVFGVDVTLKANGKATYPAPTLLEALDANGGGINALARHAVAALLNIANPDIGYGIGSTGALITMVHDAIVSGDEAQIEALHVLLADYNEAGCPINQRGEPIISNGIVI